MSHHATSTVPRSFDPSDTPGGSKWPTAIWCIAVASHGASRIRPPRLLDGCTSPPSSKTFAHPRGSVREAVWRVRRSSLAAMTPWETERMRHASWSTQGDHFRRFEWGPSGAELLAQAGSIIVVVDVLRFTTAVEAVVARGSIAYPYRWKDATARAFADSLGAQLFDGPDAAGISLSPRALLNFCLLYTSDAADDLTRVDLGERG